MIATKTLKWITVSVAIAIAITIITLSCVCSSQHKKIVNYKSQVKALTEQVDSLARANTALGSLNAININCSIKIESKNILGVSTINSNNIAKSVSTMTRQELLMALDSLQKAPVTNYSEIFEDQELKKKK